MKQKGMLIAALAVSCAAALTITACDHLGTVNGFLMTVGFAIEVTNSRASLNMAPSGMAASAIPGTAMAAIVPSDEVELYIQQLAYMEDANNRALFLISHGEADMGTKGGKLNNAGWYSVHADLRVQNDVNSGPYSAFEVWITKLRVNGVEYVFPLPQDTSGIPVFGNPSSVWTVGQGRVSVYPDNFSGITITDNTKSLKTVITVEPDILSSGVLAADPYPFIKVEGRVNE